MLLLLTYLKEFTSRSISKEVYEKIQVENMTLNLQKMGVTFDTEMSFHELENLVESITSGMCQ